MSLKNSRHIDAENGDGEKLDETINVNMEINKNNVDETKNIQNIENGIEPENVNQEVNLNLNQNQNLNQNEIEREIEREFEREFGQKIEREIEPGNNNPKRHINSSTRMNATKSSKMKKNMSRTSFQAQNRNEKKNKAKKKRVRTVMNQLQLRALGNVFNANKFPSTEIREEIARSIKMSPRSVQIWFQNQRQKNKINRMSQENPWRGLDLLAEAAEIMWQRDQAEKALNETSKT